MDDELEAAIDEVGREAVFLRAAQVGWLPGSNPPKWVWWEIVRDLRGQGFLAAPANQPTRH